MAGMVMGLLDALFPPRCVGCGATGAWLCATCMGRMEEGKLPHTCPHGEPVTLCPRCEPGWTDLAGVRVVGVYAPPLKSAIWALKFTGKRQCAPALGQVLAEQWSHDPRVAVEGIVAVPPSAEGEQRRGYNQALLLAHACVRALHLPLWEGAVVRTRAAPPQLGKDAAARRANVRGLFAVPPRQAALIAGRRVLVVDDVLTTGATLNAVAGALRAAGAAEVYGLVLARPRTNER